MSRRRMTAKRRWMETPPSLADSADGRCWTTAGDD